MSHFWKFMLQIRLNNRHKTVKHLNDYCFLISELEMDWLGSELANNIKKLKQI